MVEYELLIYPLMMGNAFGPSNTSLMIGNALDACDECAPPESNVSSNGRNGLVNGSIFGKLQACAPKMADLASSRRTHPLAERVRSPSNPDLLDTPSDYIAIVKRLKQKMILTGGFVN
jgi:hypothetical protein